MVFCNNNIRQGYYLSKKVTILILIDGFLQFYEPLDLEDNYWVTILILIDGFLQYYLSKKYLDEEIPSQSLF